MSWNIEEVTGYKPITTFWDGYACKNLIGDEAKYFYNITD